MFWLPTQTGFNIKEMDWLKYWMSREGTGFRAGCPEFWVLDSVFRPVWLSCSVWEPAGWSHTRPHTSTMISRERGRTFPEFCPKYGETFAKSSRHACQGPQELEQELRAVPEPISFARHGARVGEPIADRQHGATAHQGPASSCSQSLRLITQGIDGICDMLQSSCPFCWPLQEVAQTNNVCVGTWKKTLSWCMCI